MLRICSKIYFEDPTNGWLGGGEYFLESNIKFNANREAKRQGGHDGSRVYEGHEGEVVEEQGKGP